ncbi:MAG: transglutaminase domain-containing protein [Planctomyces sp.]|nr:transglutaminase domain-containing protein [Planctomyces sp.]
MRIGIGNTLLLLLVCVAICGVADMMKNSSSTASTVVAGVGNTVGEDLPNDRRFVPSTSLEEYGQQLAACGKAGPQVRAQTASLRGTPTQRLIAVYQQLRDRWHYRPDGDAETFQTAEASVGTLQYQGDCEDFAATMMAALSTIDGLTSRIVICHGRLEGEPGHAFCEVLIADDLRSASPVLHRLRSAWNLPELVCHGGPTGVWVPLDFTPPRKAYDGSVYCFISNRGTVTYPTE